MTSLTFDIYVRAAPRQVQAALADSALVPRWITGIEFQPTQEGDQRLTNEWLQTDNLATNGQAASVVRFEFIAMGDVTRLTVNHGGLAPGGSFLKVIAAGWPMILSSLKSLVETGEPLTFCRTACEQRR